MNCSDSLPVPLRIVSALTRIPPGVAGNSLSFSDDFYDDLSHNLSMVNESGTRPLSGLTSPTRQRWLQSYLSHLANNGRSLSAGPCERANFRTRFSTTPNPPPPSPARAARVCVVMKNGTLYQYRTVWQGNTYSRHRGPPPCLPKARGGDRGPDRCARVG